MTDIDATCSGCVYVFPVVTDNADARAECRRYPPQMFVFEGEVFNGFPNAEDRCGEYKADMSTPASTMLEISYVCAEVINRNGTYSNSYTAHVFNRFITYEVESNQPLNGHILKAIVKEYYLAGLWYFRRDELKARIREFGDEWKGDL